MELYRSKSTKSVVEAYQTKEQIDVETVDGLKTAFPGDYILTGVYGEQYVYSNGQFDLDYVKEVVDE